MSDLLDVGSHQRLTTRKGYEYFVRVDVGCDGVERTEKYLGRHILDIGHRATVATAVAAVEIATQCALPEEHLEFVLSGELLAFACEEFERDALA